MSKSLFETLIPVDKGIGEAVICGTINRFGTIDIRATEVGQDSSLQKMIHMVQEAEDHQIRGNKRFQHNIMRECLRKCNVFLWLQALFTLCSHNGS